MSKEIGERIKRISKSQGWNQPMMAEQLGLTPGAYAKIERGETDPSISRLYEIAKILKVDILELLEDEPRQKESPVTRAEFNNLHKQLNGLQKVVDALSNDSPGKPKTGPKKK